MKIAICPGSFDPITIGHMDLAARAAAIFDKVILCVMVNGEKNPMFSLAERLELARAATARLANVEAAACDGLLADFAQSSGACALVKGVRGASDLDWEIQMAQINRDLYPKLDTVFLPTRPEHLHVSSTLVREMLRYDRPAAPYIPPETEELLRRIRQGKVR